MGGQNETDRIELVFTRPRLAGLIVAALLTACGLLATGIMAGIEIGSARAPKPTEVRASTAPLPIPAQPPSVPEPAAVVRPVVPTVVSPVVPPVVPPDTQGFVVQVASFLSTAEAEALAADLLQKHYSAETIARKDAGGRTWSIVMVGPYAQRAAALEIADELTHFSRSKPIVRASIK